ncbi:P-loop containing nucleoside triphosphate hydrolase protein [Mycena leptocephala]|nr:P-loop containing nucleoside triphosphate hydrolase protein [Mycena leptocephala]
MDPLRNVSSAYPSGKSKDNAIKKVSLKIPAGHLVLMVSANGRGNSTIIKLLNRLYDVDSGEILVQGMLTHKLYPLTLAENIGLGDPNRGGEMEKVMQAAEMTESRTFMHFLSGNIRFAVADEPSSAEAGGGKTMNFVTHRFGHLTKHADLIIRPGGISLKELMARGGEYFELYNVQSQATVTPCSGWSFLHSSYTTYTV